MSTTNAPGGAGETVTAVSTQPFVCPDCKCRSYARVTQQKDDGSFAPGPLVRCVHCKTVYRDANAEEFAALSASPVPGSGEDLAANFDALDRELWKENFSTAHPAVQALYKLREAIGVSSSRNVSPSAGVGDQSAIKDALANCAEAVAFFDQVKAASEDEKAAVGVDHWNWLESAVRRAAALSAPHPDPAQAAPAQGYDTQAARDVLAERRRQVEAEGWSPDHDDALESEGQMAGAAACYAFGMRLWHGEPNGQGYLRNAATVWPWADHYWKPTDRRRNLVKAGALILAEIERLDRASPPASPIPLGSADEPENPTLQALGSEGVRP